MKTCYLFPGQGAQYASMGRDFLDAGARAKDIMTCASDVTGMDVRRLLYEADDDELMVTDNAQVTIAVVSLCVSAALAARGITADASAGLSLGEYPALCEAGVLTPETMFRLIRARGVAMDKACKALEAAGGAGMCVVLGISREAIAEALEKAGIADVTLANHNSPVQSALSGTKESLARVTDVMKAAGAKRVQALRVAGPFHSPLMKAAADEFGASLADGDFRDPVKTVFSNVTGKPIASGAEAKRLAVEQIVSGVRWVDIENSIIAGGIGRCFETGPGKVLTNLWGAVSTEIPCLPAGTLAAVQAIS